MESYNRQQHYSMEDTHFEVGTIYLNRYQQNVQLIFVVLRWIQEEHKQDSCADGTGETYNPDSLDVEFCFEVFSNIPRDIIVKEFTSYPAEEAFNRLLNYERSEVEDQNKNFLDEFEHDMMELSVMHLELEDDLQNPEAVHIPEEEKEPQQKEEQPNEWQLYELYQNFEEQYNLEKDIQREQLRKQPTEECYRGKGKKGKKGQYQAVGTAKQELEEYMRFEQFLNILPIEHCELLFNLNQKFLEEEETKKLIKQIQEEESGHSGARKLELLDKDQFPGLGGNKSNYEQNQMQDLRHNLDPVWSTHGSGSAVSVFSTEFELIRQRFPKMKYDLIQSTFDLIKDENIVLNLFFQAFPSQLTEKTRQDKNDVKKMMQNLKKPKEGKIGRQYKNHNGQGNQNHNRNAMQNVANLGNFWTANIVNRFLRQNWTKINQQDRKAYDQSRDYATNLHAQREDCIRKAKELRKTTNDQNQINYYMSLARDYQNQYEKAQSCAREQIFSIANSFEKRFNAIDLHGMRVQEAERIAEDRLIEVQGDLRKGSFEPNMGNKVDHVFKIVCGAGNHSKGGVGILKQKIKQYLESRGYDYYPIWEHGVLLVRLQKV